MRQGGTPKIFAHMTRTAISAEQDHPQIGSCGSSPLTIRDAKTLIKRPTAVEYTTLKGVTEAGFGATTKTANPHIPRSCSTPC